MKILFQGDSITDCGRDRNHPNHLGNGYPRYAAQMIREMFPDRDFEFVNQGISGDRTMNLMARWQKECIDFQPDVLSVLIGINDVWRAFDSNSPTTAEKFEENYRSLLEDVKNKTNAKIVLLEPFVLVTGGERASWHLDLDPKIKAVRRLAREYADAYVPLDGLFAAACISRPPCYWAGDGVHPTDEGAWFIARHYAEAVRQMIQ